jgi:hypothetical protein
LDSAREESGKQQKSSKSEPGKRVVCLKDRFKACLSIRLARSSTSIELPERRLKVYRLIRKLEAMKHGQKVKPPAQVFTSGHELRHEAAAAYVPASRENPELDWSLVK